MVNVVPRERTPTIHDDMTIISAGNGPMRSQVRDMDQWEDRDWEMDQSDFDVTLAFVSGKRISLIRVHKIVLTSPSSHSKEKYPSLKHPHT